MSYNHKTLVGVDIVEFEENMDLYSVPEVKKFCKELLTKGTKKLLVNLEKVTYMDSSALGMLINLRHECNEKNVTLKLAALTEECKKLFDLTKMQNNFEIFETVNEAIRSFG